jgi:hypothetical protein
MREECRLRVFGPKKDGVTGDWSRFYVKNLHDLCSLPHVILVIKSRRMRWVGHVAFTGRRGAASFGGDNGGRERERQTTWWI